jgi:phenylalanyl-tRNA synthetase beta chain
MLISHKWLKNYLPELDRFSTATIAESLTISLAEVEQIFPIRQELSNIVIGEVIEVKKHENSDKLSICQVTTDGNNRLQIICGAPNVKEQIKVAVCLPGGKVYADTKGETTAINTTTIRGVESFGMICSERELGIGDNHTGIMILEDNLPIGDDLTDLLKDWVYEIENKSISHRGDCFSHTGIARELSAILAIDFLEDTTAPESILPSGSGKKLNIEISVNKDLCKRFSALLIENIVIKDSPIWLKARLSSVGERSINNVVDITNFVMLDKGQPLHAYDYDKLIGNKLIVRKAKNNEKVKTLDGIERTLDNTMLVISDEKNVEDIAGIMGGHNSQISSETNTILLEAANFDMYNIRRSSRQLGLRSEASTRFEKGIDQNLTVPTIRSAYTLISDLTGGEVSDEIFDYYPEPTLQKTVEIDVKLINRLLTTDFTKYEIIDLLKRLQVSLHEQENSDGAEPNLETQTLLTFVIPSFRKDLNIKEDLVEEVARIYGFKNISPKLPEKDLTPAKIYNRSQLFRLFTNSLSALGFTEVKSYSFIGESDISKSNLNPSDNIKLSNSLAPELKYVRNSIIPSMLSIIKKNQPKYTNAKIFEINRIVEKKLNQDGIHIQPWTITLAINHKVDDNNAFQETKGITEYLAKLLNITFKYKNLTSGNKYVKTFHPYQSAEIFVESEQIGFIGLLHPEVIYNNELQGLVSVAEINLDKLLPYVNQQKTYKSLPNFPETNRDLSFWIPNKVSYQDVEHTINKLNLELLVAITLKDTYTNEEGNTSYTITLTFSSNEKTLTDTEVDKLEGFIAKELQTKLDLKLRTS